MTVEKGADDELDTRRGYGCPLPRFLSLLYTTKDVEGKGRGLILNDPGFLGVNKKKKQPGKVKWIFLRQNLSLSFLSYPFFYVRIFLV